MQQQAFALADPPVDIVVLEPAFAFAFRDFDESPRARGRTLDTARLCIYGNDSARSAN